MNVIFGWISIACAYISLTCFIYMICTSPHSLLVYFFAGILFLGNLILTVIAIRMTIKPQEMEQDYFRKTPLHLTDEIIELFNKTFEGKLPPVIRATEYTLRKLDQCISLYGRESVDEVFAQVLSEPFMLGETESEFRATFQYIFEPDVFKSILLRSRKEKGGKTC